jgi:hypothetical protein
MILDELGDDQEYQLFYENDLGGTLPAGDTEIVVGLDMSKQRQFCNASSCWSSNL